MDGGGRNVTDHGVTEEDTIDGNMWRNLVLGARSAEYSGQIHEWVNTLSLSL